MPTYQYRCKKCSEEFEKTQSFSDDSTPKCPGCGTRSKKNISKVFSAVGIAFKGSGFYKNDHGKKGSSSGGSGASSTSSDKTSTDSSTKKADAPAKSSSSSD